MAGLGSVIRFSFLIWLTVFAATYKRMVAGTRFWSMPINDFLRVHPGVVSTGLNPCNGLIPSDRDLHELG